MNADNLNMEKTARQRKRDQGLKDSFAKRLTVCFNLLQATIPRYDQKKFSEDIGVSPSTLSSYMSGSIFPGPETIIKISNRIGKSIDWLLKGDESPVPSDQTEIAILYKFRQIRDAGKMCEYESYTNFLLNQIGGDVNINKMRMKPRGDNSFEQKHRLESIGCRETNRKKEKEEGK